MSHQQDSWDDVVRSWNANDVTIDKQIPSDSVLIAQINKQIRHKKIVLVVDSVTSIALAGYVISEEPVTDSV